MYRKPVSQHRVLPLFLVVMLGVTLLWAAPSARADVRDFPFTYEWFQNSKGERELAYHLGYLGNGDSFKHEFEFEYGVTRRFSVAPYLVLKNGGGRSLHYDAVKVETRYQLGDFRPNRVLAGLYLEVEQANREALELEGKLILSRYDRHGGNLSFNFILHRQLGSGDRLEPSYSLAFAHGRAGGVRPGIEWLHDLDTGRLNAGPTIAFDAGIMHIAAGYAFAVNGINGNKGELRLLAEHHF